ncbi:MAG: hypothetical protein WAK93_04805 [Solirubrobacteraceae bacterium]
MTGSSGSDGELSPPERALNNHLELLRLSPPESRPGIVARIVRTARWQHAVRRPVLAIAAVAAAALDGIRLLFLGSRRR